MNNNKFLKYVRLVLLVTAGVLFVYLLWMNFSPLGEQTITYSFEESPFVEGLRPSTRIQDIECQKNIGCSQVIFSDPIYFDLLLPRRFQSVKLEVKYQDPSEEEIRVGVRVGDEWQYYEETLVTQQTDNTWTTGVATLNLKIATIQANKATFVLSTKHIKDNPETIKIEEIKFHLKRDTYSKRIKSKLHDWYTKIFK
jgi:hypothetical protein